MWRLLICSSAGVLVAACSATSHDGPPVDDASADASTLPDVTIVATEPADPSSDVTRTLDAYPDRPYLVHWPRGVPPTTPVPVVLALHGGGGSAPGALRITCPSGNLASPQCLEALADAQGFAVVAPNGTGTPAAPAERTWNAGGGTGDWQCVSGRACATYVDDIAYFNSLLDDLEANFSVDAKRIYATGISNGGAMAHRLGCELSERIAAIAPVEGGNQYATGAPCAPVHPMPVIELQGTADPCWAADGGPAACLQKDGKNKVDISTTIAGWTALDGCNPTPVLADLPDTDPSDGTTTQTQSYAGCSEGSEIVLYLVAGGGHTWPRGFQYQAKTAIGLTAQDFSANDVIWAFLQAHSLP